MELFIKSMKFVSKKLNDSLYIKIELKFLPRSLNHPELISSVKSYRSKRGESESSNEEEGKPLEKPSCKVPCIPRADHVTNVTKVPAMPRAEHVARGQHEKRESVSPDRDQSPDQVYHRYEFVIFGR